MLSNPEMVADPWSSLLSILIYFSNSDPMKVIISSSLLSLILIEQLELSENLDKDRRLSTELSEVLWYDNIARRKGGILQ